MKSFLLTIFIMIFLSSISYAQTISIADVQDTSGGAGGGESRLIG